MKNRGELYSLRVLTPSESDGVVAASNHIVNDWILLQQKKLQIFNSRILDDNSDYNDNQWEYDLSNYETIYIFLLKTRDIQHFDTHLAEIQSHISTDVTKSQDSTVSSSPYVYENSFCSQHKYFECQSIKLDLNQESMVDLVQYEFTWNYYQHNATHGYLINQCSGHCEMSHAWIGCRETSLFETAWADDKYHYFADANYGDVRIYAKDHHKYKQPGSYAWDEPILVKVDENVNTTCHFTFKMSSLTNAYHQQPVEVTDEAYVRHLGPHSVTELPSPTGFLVKFPKAFNKDYKPKTLKFKKLCHHKTENRYLSRLLEIGYKYDNFISQFPNQFNYDYRFKTYYHSFTFENGTVIPFTDNNKKNQKKSSVYDRHPRVGNLTFEDFNQGGIFNCSVVVVKNVDETNPYFERSQPFNFTFVLPKFDDQYNNYVFSNDTNKSSVNITITPSPNLKLVLPKLFPIITDKSGATYPNMPVTFDSTTRSVNISNINYSSYEQWFKFLTLRDENQTIWYEMPLYLVKPAPAPSFPQNGDYIISGKNGITGKWSPGNSSPYFGWFSDKFEYVYQIFDAVTKRYVKRESTRPENFLVAADNRGFMKWFENNRLFTLQVKQRYTDTDWWKSCLADDSAYASLNVTVTFDLQRWLSFLLGFVFFLRLAKVF